MKEELNARPLFEGFDNELTLDPRTQYAPIPKKLISVMVKRGVLSIPVTPEQEEGLRMLKWAFEDKSKLALRFMLGTIRKRDRQILVEYPHMGKIERYMLKMFLSEKKWSLKAVQESVSKAFKVDYALEEIKVIRKMAYDYRAGKTKSVPFD